MTFLEFIVVSAFIFLMVDCCVFLMVDRCAGLLDINKFNCKLICILAVKFLLFAGGLLCYIAFG